MCPKGENKQEVCDRTDQVTTNNKDGTEVIVENNNNKPVIVKFSCDICNISVNSATQLSQVSIFFHDFFFSVKTKLQKDNFNETESQAQLSQPQLRAIVLAIMIS